VRLYGARVRLYGVCARDTLFERVDMGSVRADMVYVRAATPSRVRIRPSCAQIWRLCMFLPVLRSRYGFWTCGYGVVTRGYWLGTRWYGVCALTRENMDSERAHASFPALTCSRLARLSRRQSASSH